MIAVPRSAAFGVALAVAIGCLSERATAAPNTARAQADAQPSAGRRALATGAAIVPGIIVHGTGNYVAGRPRTGRRLLIAEGIGVGATLIGGLTLFFSGASRYIVAPVAAVTIAGVGLFAVSWLADVDSVAWPEDERGLPPRFAPRLESELGYRYVYDPQFSYRSFLVDGFELRLGRARIAPSEWFSLNDNHNARYRLELGWRLAGPLPKGSAPPAIDGSRFDLEVALTDHRYKTDGFSIATAEASLGGRLDLARFDAELSGAFSELSAGYALEAFDYDVPGLGFGADLEHLLLLRFGFGVYVGRGSYPEGEILAYYDHRHDGFAAGLLFGGIVSGIAGHFGGSAKIYFDRHFGVLADVEYGSAWVAGASLLYRYGAIR